MGIRAGAKDRLVRFYPRTMTTDALGVEVEADGTPVPAWASVLFGTGSERREAGQAGSQQTATFRVGSSADLRTVTERWEISFLSARWGITSIAPIGEADDIEFTAVKKGA
jgi:head-tail adaptor